MTEGFAHLGHSTSFKNFQSEYRSGEQCPGFLILLCGWFQTMSLSSRWAGYWLLWAVELKRSQQGFLLCLSITAELNCN